MFERLKSWIGAPTGTAKILLAEDDPEMRELLAMTLRRDGHEVIPFADGKHLLAYLESIILRDDLPAPDLVISDVLMPGYTGLEILAALREADIDVPVILITAFGDRKAHDQAFELGAAMLDKPFAIDALRDTVRCLVR